MSSVSELERAVEQLAPEELAEFRAWFAQRDAADWDIQFERDVAAGKLDALADEAIKDFREGRCREL